MDEENRAMDLQDDLEAKASGIGKGKYGRILKMARTPTKEEYKKTVYITALGIIILGGVGFGIMWIMTYLPTYF